MTLTSNQTLWLAALRSGDYAQCRSVLKSPTGYCCLGVAAELFKTPETQVVIYDDGNTAFDDHTGIAPPYVVEALGLISTEGESNDGKHMQLTEMNDTGRSFTEIANLTQTPLRRPT